MLKVEHVTEFRYGWFVMGRAKTSKWLVDVANGSCTWVSATVPSKARDGMWLSDRILTFDWVVYEALRLFIAHHLRGLPRTAENHKS